MSAIYVEIGGIPDITVTPCNRPERPVAAIPEPILSRGGFEYSLDWLPISGLFLQTEYRYSQFGAADVPITGGIGGIPLTGATLNSQKAPEMILTELVWRFKWFGR